MKWFMRFHYKGSPTAMGFHRGVLPGYAASHGCVRLPAKMAEWFFTNVPSGTRILVRGKSNGVPIGASQNRPKRSPKVHSSLKKPKKPVDTVPSAPESDIQPSTALPAPTAPAPTAEPAPAAADPGIPAPAPSPDPTANEAPKDQ